MSAAPDMLAAALAYADRGWPVFPLHTPDGNGGCSCRRSDCAPKETGKHPRTPNGLNDATTDQAVIRRWWSKWPDANVAVRTGVACDMFDVDHDDLAEGTADLETFVMPGGPVVRTGAGWHFYLLPTGLGNRTRFVSNCDWRGIGGYAILPPSLHYSGRRYEWFVPFNTALNVAPPELLKALQPKLPPSPAQGPLVGAAAAAGYSLPRRAYMGRFDARKLIDLVRAAGEGTRNNMLNWAAVATGYAVYNRRCTESDGLEVLAQLEQAAIDAGLAPTAVAATAASGYNAGRSGADPAVSKATRNAA